jgi:hypothetical protein
VPVEPVQDATGVMENEGLTSDTMGYMAINAALAAPFGGMSEIKAFNNG